MFSIPFENVRVYPPCLRCHAELLVFFSASTTIDIYCLFRFSIAFSALLLFVGFVPARKLYNDFFEQSSKWFFTVFDKK
jgi:hypothetical protein